jgi:hypothetical protein
MPASVEAAVLEARRQRSGSPNPSGVYPCLVRAGLVEPDERR